MKQWSDHMCPSKGSHHVPEPDVTDVESGTLFLCKTFLVIL